MFSNEIPEGTPGRVATRTVGWVLLYVTVDRYSKCDFASRDDYLERCNPKIYLVTWDEELRAPVGYTGRYV